MSGTGTANQVRINGTPTNGANPWLDSLVSGGAWIDTPGLPSSGGPVTISYAFVSGSFNGTPSRAWSTPETNAAERAFGAWEAVANVDFVRVSSSASADVRLWSLSSSQIGVSNVLGFSEIPGFSSNDRLEMGFNSDHITWSAAGLGAGGYGYLTLLHELGHLLGLAHPHDGGPASDATLFPGVTAAFDDYGDYNFNQGIYSIMSYNAGWSTLYPNHNFLDYGWSATPMAFDIAAIQAIYGANTTYPTGSDTYALATINAPGTFFSCIWDAGGGGYHQ
jgi:serralysin